MHAFQRETVSNNAEVFIAKIRTRAYRVYVMLKCVLILAFVLPAYFTDYFKDFFGRASGDVCYGSSAKVSHLSLTVL